MVPCVALESQRGLRDIRHLPPEAVRWVGDRELADADEPAILCGLWASRDPSARQVLQRRQERGCVTLLVARFEPGDLSSVLGAPVAVRVVAVEGSEVTWEDGTRFLVPAMAAVEASLPEGHWARVGAKTAVLAWRPHTTAGLTILCTATVAGPALGAEPSIQLQLLERILDEAGRRTVQPRFSTTADEPKVADSASDYLVRHGDGGALMLLAWLAAPGPEVDAAAVTRLGANLEPEELRRLAAGLPQMEPIEVHEALLAAGWGAHLRVFAERPTEEA